MLQALHTGALTHHQRATAARRRSPWLLALLWLWAFAAQAQITVPTANTNAGSQRYPLGTFFGYERTASIYTAGEIGASGTITSIGYYVNSISSPTASPTKIYLKTTSASTLTGSTVAAEETGATLVYNATIPATSFVANGWTTLTLTTPFVYNGTSNLEIIVETNATGGGSGGSTTKMFRYSNATNSTQIWLQDTNPPTGNGSIISNRPNIQLSGLTPLPCTAPSGLAAGSITTTSASISFTAGNGNTSYTVTYTPQGGSAVTVSPNPTASPVALTGLAPSTQYTVSVTGNCAGGATSTAATTTFTTLTPPPANDECAGATPITNIGVGTCGTAVAGTNVGATASSGPPAPGCASYSGGDVWFSLTVPTNGIVQVSTDQGSGTSLSDTGLALYSGSCGSLTLLGCDDDSGPGAFSLLRLTGLTPGATLYARVWEYGNDATGSFTICAQTDPACAPPTAVAASSITSTSASIGFTAGNGNTSYTVTYTPQGGSAVTVSPAPTASPVALTGLTPSTQYTVSVTGNCAGGVTSTAATTTFTTLAPPPANDDCANAILLTSATSCTTTSGTTTGATASTATGTCVGTADDDVWYKFVATNTTHTITVTGVTGFDAVLNLRAGACPGTTVGSCTDNTGDGGTETITATSLTPGQTYYVRVFEYYTGSGSGSFTICVTEPAACAAPTAVAASSITSTSASIGFTAGNGNTSYTVTYTPQGGSAVTVSPNPTASPVALTGLAPSTQYTVSVTGNCAGGAASTAATTTFTTLAPPPANDDCANATTITCGQTISGTTVGATTTGEPTAACGSGGNTPSASPSVFYRFVGTGDVVTVSTCGTGTTIDTELFVYTGTCSSLTCVDSNDDFSGCSANASASQVTFTSVAGTVYYFMVQRYSFTSATGAFAINVSCTPPPTCAPPTAVAAGSVTPTSASIGFTASASATSYTVTYTPQGGSAVTVSPNPTASPVALTGLTPSTQYTVLVTSNCSGGLTAPASTITFTTPALPPANDECAGATPISSIGVGTCGTAVAGTNVGATASSGPPAPGCASYSGGDVWFSLTVPANGIVQVSTDQGSGTSLSDTGLALYSGSCGSLTLLGCDDDGGPGAFSLLRLTGLTPGATLYARVWDYGNDDTGSFTVCAQTDVPNLTVSSLQNVQGAYGNVTITGTGIARLTGALTVTGTLTVQSGGILATNCQSITGSGSFDLQAGGHLRICDAAGISTSGATGAVQVTGTRTFSDDAIYAYNGTGAQTTGSGLPSRARALIVRTSGGLTLTNPLRLLQGVLLNGGNLTTNGNALTLLSSAAGTALIINRSGVVNGNVTVQRYIDPSLNAGTGYRHYAAPVSGTTLADLTTTGFTPTVNPAYNTATRPGSVTPFPTVFAYDEARVLTSPATTYSAFDKGWVSPAALSDPMEVGRGYTVNLPAGALVDFVGTANNGTYTRNFTRAGGSAGGLFLVGNPYPSPVDFSRLTVPSGIDNAMYVFQSTGQYTGAYRSYVNGVGNGRIATGQGFFMRLSDGSNAATLALTNDVRDTVFVATSFNRDVETRPLVQLQLRGAGSALPDDAYVYFEAGATAGFDARFDALKLQHNSGGVPSVYALAAGTELSINGLPQLSSTTVVPLGVEVPAAGTYTLEAAQLLNLSHATVYLHDNLTGQDVDLSKQPRYAFSVAASALPNGRFELRFEPARPTATTPGLTAASVGLYPNPAHHSFQLLVPALEGARQVQATLLNSLGQRVGQQTAALPAAGTKLTFDVTGLATGVYMVRLQAGDVVVTKRVVID